MVERERASCLAYPLCPQSILSIVTASWETSLIVPAAREGSVLGSCPEGLLYMQTQPVNTVKVIEADRSQADQTALEPLAITAYKESNQLCQEASGADTSRVGYSQAGFSKLSKVRVRAADKN